MRCLLQRVVRARVETGGKTTGEITGGLLVFIAFREKDSPAEMEWMIKKMINLRIFSDENGKMNHSVQDIRGEILVVSQFTLYADSRKGNRPSFTASAPPSVASGLYEKFIDLLREKFSGKVETGIFGGDMQVSLMNDGPVTVLLEKEREDKGR